MKRANPTVLTPEQQKNAVRFQRSIKREGLGSVMNNTKWAEAEHALLTIPGFRPQFRAKCEREPISCGAGCPVLGCP